MFAALLIVCSVNASNCEIVTTPAIFPTEVACKEGAAQFLVGHADQLTRGFGHHEVSLWCRKFEGNPT